MRGAGKQTGRKACFRAGGGEESGALGEGSGSGPQLTCMHGLGIANLLAGELVMLPQGGGVFARFAAAVDRLDLRGRRVVLRRVLQTVGEQFMPLCVS
jgi:hypothetical protein